MSQLSLDFDPPQPTATEPVTAPPEAGPGAGEDWRPPDQAERDRILAELDANLLVEAGAGSGKTTSMVGRMVELVRAGREVERIAAVTFTRKAAADLRERFQEALERAYRTAVATGDGAGRERFGAALDGIDRCFLGTIHAFCARLLRERPLEAGLPPDFHEVTEVDQDRLRDESWVRVLERMAGRPHSRLMRTLAAHGLRPSHLKDAFAEVAENPDVRFPAPPAPPLDPADVAGVRRQLERLMDASERLLPAQEPARGWDDIQAKVRRLRFRRRVVGWDRELDFLLDLEDAVQGKNALTQNRWGEDAARKRAAKELGERWTAFCDEDGPAHRLLETWWAHRYRAAMRFARAAAGAYAADRIRLGKLTFQDLLVRAAALLRSHPGARADLGQRYRWLLVDEFQDTDPVQAEVLLLLASDPADDPADDPRPTATPAPASSPLWLSVAPRPGALFVVGDPKQSIYRFRRADIAVYNQVKRRFREFGDILHLVTNFRSRPPIETLVDHAFRDAFPAEENEHQAAFAPLRVRPRDSDPQDGVYFYRFDPLPLGGSLGGRKIAEAECHLLASWIRERIDRGERRAGDFMVLAARKKELATYARALEARGIPIEVAGAGVGAEQELTELVLLLRALADPDDPVLILAVLEGLFFGLSHAQLLAYARAGGRLTLMAPPPAASLRDRDDDAGDAGSADDAAPVAEALDLLRSFRQAVRRTPADAAVATIVERLGILPWAAAGDLGATRAGAVVYALDALRAAARDGAASLPEAIQILETALQQEVDAPLVPGQTDAVRVMNLHKAKGLEAPVVVLAYPARLDPPDPRRHVARDAGGQATGWLRLADPTQRGRVIARPLDWRRHHEAELPFQQAEEVRRLYVAATRAARELVVARCDRTEDNSCWAPLHAALDADGVASELRPVARRAPERDPLREDAGDLAGRIDHVTGARDALARPTYRAQPVTNRVHGTGPGAISTHGTGHGTLLAHATAAGTTASLAASPAADPPPSLRPGDGETAAAFPRCEILYLAGPEFRAADAPPPTRARGPEWGSAVHRALEAASQKVQGDVLRALCHAALVEFDRPVDPGSGEPTELDELIALVEAVRSQPIWDRVRSARRVLVEAPFAFPLGPDAARSLGIHEPADTEIVEGTIDLAFQDSDGRWTVVDFKTDARTDPARDDAYRRQVQLYAMGLVAADSGPVAR